MAHSTECQSPGTKRGSLNLIVFNDQAKLLGGGGGGGGGTCPSAPMVPKPMYTYADNAWCLPTVVANYLI